MSSLFVALLLVGLVPNSSVAADWQVSAEGNELTSFSDVNSLRRDGKLVKVWQKFLFDKPRESVSGKVYQSSRDLTYYDCEARVYATKSFTLFSGADLDGEIVYSRDIPKGELEWSDIPPDTVSESAMEFACSKAPK
jgi:hypothetical protein